MPTLKKCGTLLATLAGIVGIIWGAFCTLDTRYANAEDVRQDMRSLQQSILEVQKSQLEREQFEIQRDARKRRLTDLEASRLEVQTLDRRIEALEKK
jgi:hypothetical protein